MKSRDRTIWLELKLKLFYEIYFVLSGVGKKCNKNSIWIFEIIFHLLFSFSSVFLINIIYKGLMIFHSCFFFCFYFSVFLCIRNLLSWRRFSGFHWPLTTWNWVSPGLLHWESLHNALVAIHLIVLLNFTFLIF